ncbi:NfeD family protein [Alteromonas lipolytica]|uniref:Activity regulator of membrane protease YbbK n=1 Tax=Alteromonas lipolytica TaxID=1856405 RepID=A0A1E8FJR4_9ALTE|nr:NfeD family protein [Alteromonas lipolytica]OFI36181.1 activity regulator of membrane protease YbbK [Alteromonas lipolytica]GGF78465.1 hypothetical protein GCM10011338_33580 [Alteromonas lipolytica]
MDWITANVTTVLVITGLLLLIIEVAILGFATFVLFFVGLAALVTAGLFYIGLLDASYVNAFFSSAIFSAIFAVLLYKPLKQMQQQVDNKTVKGDFTGLRFHLAEDISPARPGKHTYSGITWAVQSNSDIAAGTEVEVVNAEVGIFHVRPVTTTA